MHRQVVLAPSRRLHPSGPVRPAQSPGDNEGPDPAGNPLKKSFLALAGAAVLLLGCQDGSGTAPGALEPSESRQRSETDRGTPGAPAGSDFSGATGATSGASEEGSAEEATRDGTGTGAETPAASGSSSASGSGGPGSAEEVSRDSGAGTGAENSAADGSDGGSDGGAAN